jgi:hypothetical protein
VMGGSVSARERAVKIQIYVIKTFALLAIKRLLDVINARLMKAAS